jgi:hypothetical protein
VEVIQIVGVFAQVFGGSFRFIVLAVAAWKDTQGENHSTGESQLRGPSADRGVAEEGKIR